VNVVQAVTAVKRDLGAVSKDKRMEAGPARYNYRSIDDVLNKMHTPLCEHGVVLVPKVVVCEREEAGATKAGTPIFRTTLHVKYDVFGPEADTLSVVTVGEALDSGDKGVNKAFTAAFKGCLAQVFAIPFATDDSDDTYTGDMLSPPKLTEKSTRSSEIHSGSSRGEPDPPRRGYRSDGEIGGSEGTLEPAAVETGPHAFLLRKVSALSDERRTRLASLGDNTGLPTWDDPHITSEGVNKYLALLRGLDHAGRAPEGS
jgi:hypothetical protein